MLFLIDFENVRSPGMRGCEFLYAADWVIVFYSANCPSMETRFLNAINDSGCRFEVCKLLQQKKNGLDFYIASRLGEIFGEGYDGTAAVISKDGGFSSLRDYWSSRSAHSRRVILHESIERAIVSAGGKEPRTQAATNLLKNQNIDSYYAAYAERQKFKEKLSEAFIGTEYADRTNAIEGILLRDASPKVVYLDALRHFGRKDGLAIYQRLKERMML